jgi:hypothetical protein
MMSEKNEASVQSVVMRFACMVFMSVLIGCCPCRKPKAIHRANVAKERNPNPKDDLQGYSEADWKWAMETGNHPSQK